MNHLPSQIDQLLEARGEIDKALRAHRAAITVMFTDVVGSTAYFDHFGDTAGVAMMFRHAELASTVIREQSGTVIKTIGDAVMASFAEPIAATRAAVVIQQRLAELNDSLPKRDQLQLRIGLNHGTAFEHAGDVFGDAVNVAARITKHTGPAQILVSSGIKEALASVSDLPCQPLGQVPLKGKEEIEELFEVLWTGEEEYLRLRKRFSEAVERGELNTLDKALVAPTAEKVDRVPETIGPYRIREPLGEGGMGTVYLAEQEKPVRRRVALKVIKLGMDTKQVVARFESERQALAMMNHTNIAKVLDAGATEQGRPYFVMEYVAGIPVTEYADKHRLGTYDRLRLFTQTCQAIQHAHQKGIIHRDIKPSNVLVSVVDGEPVLKVIDFGVAKATSQQLTEKSVYTQLGVLIGTPEYMSPEQAEMGGLDVDTTTDIYSLGVLLYELLAGALPFDSKQLREAGINEIHRIIREQEPPRLSTRISTLGDSAAEVARRRSIDLPALARQLRGDLDWITLKAMEKDRTRRYQSASELAADLERHLNHVPVVARPPSLGYQMGKFIRRHRGPVAAAIVVVVLLVGFSVTTVIQSRRIAREAKASEQISEFLVGLFRVSDPGESRGNSVTAREILDKGSEKIEEELRDQPQVQARLMMTMGEVYRSLGLYDQSESLLQSSLDLRRKELGNDHVEVGRSLHSLGVLKNEQGKYAEAENFLQQSLEIWEKELGSDHLEVARNLHNLGALHMEQGRYAEAESDYQRALAIRGRKLAPDHPDVAGSLLNLANLYNVQNKYSDAEPLYLKALASTEKTLGPDHPDVALALENLGILSRKQGNYEEAESFYQRALAIWVKEMGPDHPEVAYTLQNFAVLKMAQEKHNEAEQMLRRALAIREAKLRPGHPDVAYTLNNLGSILIAEGRLSEAESVLRRAVAILEKALAKDNPNIGFTQHTLANLYRDQEKYGEAEIVYRRAIATFEEGFGKETPYLIDVLTSYAKLFRKTGESKKATSLEARAEAIRSSQDQ